MSAFSGRPNHSLNLYLSSGGANIGGNYTIVNWSLYAVRNSGVGSWSLSPKGSWSVNIGGNVYNGGGWSYDFRSATSVLIGSGSYAIGHNSNGTGSVSGSAYADSSSTLGSASASAAMTLPTIPRTPSGLTLSSDNPTRIYASWSAQANPTGYTVQIDTQADFSTASTYTTGPSLPAYNFTGLLPGRTYYVRVRSSTAVGSSSYSAAQSLAIGIGGKYWDGTAEVPFTTAVRWDGTAEVPLTIAVRWDGTQEVPIT